MTASSGALSNHPAIYVPAGGGGGGSSFIQQENADYLLLETSSALPRDTGIPAQSSAGALDGAEWTVIVQGGTTKKISLSALATYIFVN